MTACLQAWFQLLRSGGGVWCTNGELAGSVDKGEGGPGQVDRERQKRPLSSLRHFLRTEESSRERAGEKILGV